MLVVVQPDLREPGCVGRQRVHLGTEALCGMNMRSKLAIVIADGGDPCY